MRTVLKWKYNYYEAQPYEHHLYGAYKKLARCGRRSMRFKKLWRLKMDELFDQETYEMREKLLVKLMEEREQEKIRMSPDIDPVRLLANYDNQVLKMIRKVSLKFKDFLKTPKEYPEYEEEKKNFLIQQIKSCTEVNSFLEVAMDFDREFDKHWATRISAICDAQIEKEKLKIRGNWKSLISSYMAFDNEGEADELKTLLREDNEDEEEDILLLNDSDIEMIE